MSETVGKRLEFGYRSRGSRIAKTVGGGFKPFHCARQFAHGAIDKAGINQQHRAENDRTAPQRDRNAPENLRPPLNRHLIGETHAHNAPVAARNGADGVNPIPFGVCAVRKRGNVGGVLIPQAREDQLLLRMIDRSALAVHEITVTVPSHADLVDVPRKLREAEVDCNESACGENGFLRAHGERYHPWINALE